MKKLYVQYFINKESADSLGLTLRLCGQLWHSGDAGVHCTERLQHDRVPHSKPQWKGCIRMAIVWKIRLWLDSIVNNFRCGLYDHTEVVILHKYESTYREKFLSRAAWKKFTHVRTRTVEQYTEKCACRSCGAVFLRKRQEWCQ